MPVPLRPLSTAVSSLAIAAAALLCGCGGASDSPPGGAGVGGLSQGVDEEPFDHRLRVEVGGVVYEARGQPFGPAMIFSAPEVNVQVGGPLTTAIDSGKSVSLGDYDMIMNVYTNGLEPGGYALRANRSSVSRAEDEKRGFAEVFFRSDAPFQHLKPLSGTLTIDSVEGRADGKAYRTERVQGRVNGRFRDQGNEEHELSATFDYRR